jgi:hypothetical protein
VLASALIFGLSFALLIPDPQACDVKVAPFATEPLFVNMAGRFVSSATMNVL